MASSLPPLHVPPCGTALQDKIEIIAKEMYGAAGVEYKPEVGNGGGGAGGEGTGRRVGYCWAGEEGREQAPGCLDEEGLCRPRGVFAQFRVVLCWLTAVCNWDTTAFKSCSCTDIPFHPLPCR